MMGKRSVTIQLPYLIHKRPHMAVFMCQFSRVIALRLLSSVHEQHTFPVPSRSRVRDLACLKTTPTERNQFWSFYRCIKIVFSGVSTN